MAPDYSLLLTLAGIFLVLDLAVAVWVFIVKRRARALYLVRTSRMKRLNRVIAEGDEAGLAREFAATPSALLSHLRRLLEDASPGPGPGKAIKDFVASIDLVGHAGRELRSRRLDRRIEAILALGLSESGESLVLLMESLGRETSTLGRLVALNRIARHPLMPDIPTLIACLEAGKARNRKKEFQALAGLGPRLHDYFDQVGLPPGDTGLELYLLSARSGPTEADWERLKGLALERDDAIGEGAAAVLVDCYPAARFIAAFSGRPEPRFRIPLARLLGMSLSPGELDRLDPWFHDPAYREHGIAAAALVLKAHPDAVDAFLAHIGGPDKARAACLSLAIEYRLPGLLYHSPAPLGPELKALVSALLDERRAGIILESLSVSMPEGTRQAYLGFLRTELASRPEVRAFLARHLPAVISAELSLPAPEAEEDKLQIPMKGRDKVFLAVLVALGLAVFPAAFALVNWRDLPWLSGSELLYRFVFDFQWLFAYYTLAVNGTYLVLLFLSMRKLRSQARLWECDLTRIIATGRILPSISIIAPAYNEEKTIVESVHSLLSLAYPSYQVIVVNDGSADSTLNALVSSFDLQPASSGTGSTGELASMPVRTIYRSASLPNLLVVDKANGGKADALNAGLNRATGDYVCTIDADSVLDPQALIRAMFQVVASEHEIFAIGGNVFPVNGCVVEHGHLQEISLPDEPLARFQTVEYLRSFVAGRLGWTVLDSLLIISGAFGLFKRQAVMELGGYLTGKGIYRHETVGEDMEIVVRLTRKDREEGRGGKVDYAYNANCWTEVPETWPALRRQRDRWHRGLMEVLCFHRSMTFKPRYRAAGLLSLPYFFLFELIGPWLESLGYLVLVLALVFNLIDPMIPLTVFAIAVFFGILISVASMLLAERQILYFRTKEFFKLLAVAVIENFGFRQLTSMGRVWSNFQFFFVSKGWQKGSRKGFSAKVAP